jgi:hypothetical protein
MKKLELTDLTPELLKSVAAMTNAEDVIAFFAQEGFSVGKKSAAGLLEQLAKADSLTDEQLKEIAGGWDPYHYGDT